MTKLPVLSESKQADAFGYDQAATEFAALTERFSGGIAREMIRQAALRPTDRILDVGTGTGLLPHLVAAQGSGNEVVGIDLSSGMLEQARNRASREGLSRRLHFECMDAEHLAFPDSSFDTVFSLFVLRHLPDPLAALREAKRVAKPGCRIVITIGARPSLWSAPGMTSAINFVVDQIMVQSHRRALAPTAIRSFFQREGLRFADNIAAHRPLADVADLFAEAGIALKSRTWHRKRFRLDAVEFWQVQSVFDSAVRETINSLSPERRSDLRRKFIEEGQTILNRGGALIYQTGAYIYTGAR